MSTTQGERLTITLDQGLPRVNPPTIIIKSLPKTRSQYTAMAEGDIRRERKDNHENSACWMEVILDIVVTHPHGADVWVGMWPPSLRQTLKSRFENSSNY